MATIADEVGVHIATISRAVSGKYVQCPQGILPLRSFFSGGMEDENGDERSWDAVKAKLQEIVDNEEPVSVIALNHDGHLMASGYKDSSTIRLYAKGKNQ